MNWKDKSNKYCEGISKDLKQISQDDFFFANGESKKLEMNLKHYCVRVQGLIIVLTRVMNIDLGNIFLY